MGGSWRLWRQSHRQRDEAWLDPAIPLLGLPAAWEGERIGSTLTYQPTQGRRRLRAGPSVALARTVKHRQPSGSTLTVTAYRSGSGWELERLRQELLENALRRVLSQPQLAGAQGPDPQQFEIEVARRFTASMEQPWSSREIPVDGQLHPFEVRWIDEATWVAIGTVNGHHCTLDSDGFPLEAVTLTRTALSPS
jgi:hypothetical protein